MGVLKPYGESGRYDVAVEDGGPILRVQVKSTIYCRRGNEYSLNVHGPGRKQYKKGSVDFFAVWVIPMEEWYIIPYAAMGKRQTLHFTAGSKRAKRGGQREAGGGGAGGGDLHHCGGGVFGGGGGRGGGGQKPTLFPSNRQSGVHSSH